MALTSYMQAHVHGSRDLGRNSASWEVDTFCFQIQVLGIHFTASQGDKQSKEGEKKKKKKHSKCLHKHKVTGQKQKKGKTVAGGVTDDSSMAAT